MTAKPDAGGDGATVLWEGEVPVAGETCRLRLVRRDRRTTVERLYPYDGRWFGAFGYAPELAGVIHAALAAAQADLAAARGEFQQMEADRDEWQFSHGNVSRDLAACAVERDTLQRRLDREVEVRDSAMAGSYEYKARAERAEGACSAALKRLRPDPGITSGGKSLGVAEEDVAAARGILRAAGDATKGGG